ncbi:MAG: preprotein translocase subunit SecG [Clostridia bacterium]
MKIALAIIYIIVAAVLTGVVLLQQGKDPRESAIMGGSGSFFSKNKGATKEVMLEKLTAIVAVLFVVLSIVMFIFVK